MEVFRYSERNALIPRDGAVAQGFESPPIKAKEELHLLDKNCGEDEEEMESNDEDRKGQKQEREDQSNSEEEPQDTNPKSGGEGEGSMDVYKENTDPNWSVIVDWGPN